MQFSSIYLKNENAGDATLTNDVYEPPKSELISEFETKSNLFYVVSKTKLSVLYLATLGMYTVYWFYVNWRNYRDTTGQELMPIPRAIFYIFFTHSLFSEVDSKLKLKNVEFNWAPNLLATNFVILSIAMNIIDRLASKGIGSPTTDLITLGILPFVLIILLKAQEAINLSQDDKYGKSNRSFTVYNYLWIVLGVILWLFIVVGLMGFGGYLL